MLLKACKSTMSINISHNGSQSPVQYGCNCKVLRVATAANLAGIKIRELHEALKPMQTMLALAQMSQLARRTCRKVLKFDKRSIRI